MNEKTVGAPKPLYSLLSSQPCSNRELLTAETWSRHSEGKEVNIKLWIVCISLYKPLDPKSSLSLACTVSSITLLTMVTNYIRQLRCNLQLCVLHSSFCKSFCICRALCIPESLYSSSFYYQSKLSTKRSV